MSSSCCPACQNQSKTHICPTCLTKLLKLYKGQTTSHTNSLLPAAQAKAKTGIAINKENRELEAAHAATKRDIAVVTAELAKLKRDNETASDKIRKKKTYLLARTDRLQLARAAVQTASAREAKQDGQDKAFPALSSLLQHDEQVQANQRQCSDELAETRRILMREAMDAFDVQPSSKEGRQYALGDLSVPTLRLLQALPRHQLNATLQLLVHLLRLLSLYLSIKLPFALTGSVTKPIIRPVSGSSNAAKYPKSYPLYTISSSSTSKSQASSIASSADKNVVAAAHAQGLSNGLRMLAYNVYYLLYTSFVDAVPADIQNDADDVLAMLVQTSRVSTLGYRSHVSLQPAEALRDTELPQAHDFASFNKVLDKKLEQPVDSDKRKGTYVVGGEQQKEDIDPFIIDLFGSANVAIPNE